MTPGWSEDIEKIAAKLEDAAASQDRYSPEQLSKLLNMAAALIRKLGQGVEDSLSAAMESIDPEGSA